jgi:MFS family permease
MPVRRPVFLKRLASPGAEAFATLYALESFSRALLATVIPLEALKLLGDARGVSTAFFVVSLFSLASALAVPWLIRLSARRLIYSIAFLVLAGCPLLLAGASPGLFLAGMIFRAVAIAALSICLSLYILDFVARRDFGHSEPLRLFYSAGAWSIGPFLGVSLGVVIHPWLPYALSAFCALAGLGYFWFLRMSENPAVKQPAGPTPTPLRHVGRYFAQPRLALAWLLSTGRNIWWVIFFIYAPIYAVEAGLGEIVGGAIVSLGTSYMFLMPFLGRALRRFGLRATFMFGYGMAGAMTLALPLFWTLPWSAAAILVIAAFGMILVDAGGNMLFLLAVRRKERPEMTAVYSTFRDAADILPPGIFSILLRFFEFQAVFMVSGAVALSVALLSGVIHPRLGRDAQPPLRYAAVAAGGATPDAGSEPSEQMAVPRQTESGLL